MQNKNTAHAHGASSAWLDRRGRVFNFSSLLLFPVSSFLGYGLRNFQRSLFVAHFRFHRGRLFSTEFQPATSSGRQRFFFFIYSVSLSKVN